MAGGSGAISLDGTSAVFISFSATLCRMTCRKPDSTTWACWKTSFAKWRNSPVRSKEKGNRWNGFRAESGCMEVFDSGLTQNLCMIRYSLLGYLQAPFLYSLSLSLFNTYQRAYFIYVRFFSQPVNHIEFHPNLYHNITITLTFPLNFFLFMKHP